MSAPVPLIYPKIARAIVRPSVAPRSHMSYSPSRTSSTHQAPRPPFTYRIAAASAAKRTPPRPPKAGLDFWNFASTYQSLDPPYLRSTKKDSGEDAFFAATISGSTDHVAFGVADGVGGWQDQGVDPSEFSHALCGFMAGLAESHDGAEHGKVLRPQYLLQRAYDAVINNPRIIAGGCTASLAVMDGEGGMEAANLGDSGFLILGPNKVAFRSPAQTHAFNTPYQLAKIPPRLQTQRSIFGGSNHFSEKPSQADVTKHEMKHGDIVLFATDGVWDNLSAMDTLGVVNKVMMEHGYWFNSHNFPGAETMLNEQLVRAIPKRVEGKDEDTFLPALLATAVMREAKSAGLDRRRNGPFAKEVNLRYPQEGWEGGKPDDIAVVICVAVQEPDSGSSKDSTEVKAKL